MDDHERLAGLEAALRDLLAREYALQKQIRYLQEQYGILERQYLQLETQYHQLAQYYGVHNARSEKETQ